MCPPPQWCIEKSPSHLLVAPALQTTNYTAGMSVMRRSSAGHRAYPNHPFSKHSWVPGWIHVSMKAIPPTSFHTSINHPFLPHFSWQSWIRGARDRRRRSSVPIALVKAPGLCLTWGGSGWQGRKGASLGDRSSPGERRHSVTSRRT